MKRFVKYILFFLISFLCIGNSLAQNQKISIQEDKRTRNRRIADSLYYVHTVKPAEDSIKKAKLQEINEQKEKKLAEKANSKPKKKLTAPQKDSVSSQKNSTRSDNEIPSTTLYQNSWFSERVKSQKISLKDIPDEVTLRLCGKDGTDTFCFPYKGIKTSGYGWRWGRPHTGIDIALRTGDNIYAAFDGVVRIAKYNGGYGNMVLIRHYNNLETLYGHMSAIKVKPGQKVKAGDVIGLGGSTGNSTGPHLHFECRLLYACFDPEWIVDIKKYDLKTKLVRIDKSYFGISASQTAQDKKERLSKLTKVNTLLDGTKYVSERELNKMIAKKEEEKNQPAKINNEDKSTWRYYKVKDEDTLEGISKRFNIKITDLVDINNLKDNNLKAGERIRIR
ncbi:MAG: peptidoglycan DD-metalloendopeptidase family protein [Bacteroidales bacterium]|nr:peptidoglycan DD-metalloendopeptidase family protein [Bacteroidales bacterium]